MKRAVLTDRVSIIPDYNGDNNWQSKVITDDEMLQLALQDLTELFGLEVSSFSVVPSALLRSSVLPFNRNACESRVCLQISWHLKNVKYFCCIPTFMHTGIINESSDLQR